MSWGDDASARVRARDKRRLILAIQPRFESYAVRHQRTTQNSGTFSVMLCQSVMQLPIRRRFLQGSDPNGIRTRVTAVKGRCPGPLDDRVTKPGNIGIAVVRRKPNW